MPEFSVLHIAIITVFAVVGVIAGWVMRGNRCAQEKIAVNTGWQEQIEAQKLEHGRLVDQNKGLMEQVNQFQASGKDASNRAKELSAALKEAFARRDELQREIKDVRNALQATVGERDRLQADDSAADTDASSQKDEKIAHLTRELQNWQNRLPPLIERFQVRNQEADQLEAELVAANERIEALEAMLGSEQTRVEPVDPDVMADGLDASNDDDEDALAEVVDETADDAEDLIDANEFIGDETSEAIAEVEETPEAAEDDAFVEIVDDEEDEDVEDSVDEEHSDDHDAYSDEDEDEDEDEDDEDADEDDDNLVDQLDDSDIRRHRDNLKRIKGVGPAIEKTLHELGIFRFTQIASMSEYDIDRIAKRLKGFRTRIYREDWIGQARNLQDAQSSERA